LVAGPVHGVLRNDNWLFFVGIRCGGSVNRLRGCSPRGERGRGCSIFFGNGGDVRCSFSYVFYAQSILLPRPPAGREWQSAGVQISKVWKSSPPSAFSGSAVRSKCRGRLCALRSACTGAFSFCHSFVFSHHSIFSGSHRFHFGGRQLDALSLTFLTDEIHNR